MITDDFVNAPRRHYLTMPGEGLMLAGHARTLVEGGAVFQYQAGLTDEDVILSTVVDHLVPRPAARRRWNPQMMWHPWFWLPEELLHTGLDTDVFAWQVGYLTCSAGLYDPESGWVDVFALHGLDAGNPVVQARAAAWAAGGADPDLDRISLDRYFLRDRDWMAETSLRLAPIYWRASKWVMCQSLLADLEAAGADTSLVRQTIGNAWMTLRDVPGTAGVYADPDTALPELLDAVDLDGVMVAIPKIARLLEALSSEMVSSYQAIVHAESAETEGVEVESVEARTVEAEGVEAESVEARTVEAEGVEAESVEARTVEAESA